MEEFCGVLRAFGGVEMAAVMAAASSTAAGASVRLANGKAARGSFVFGGCAQVGSSSSSLKGTGVAAISSNVSSRRQQPRKVVVSPRNVSDSPVVGEACLDPDASRVRLRHCPLLGDPPTSDLRGYGGSMFVHVFHVLTLGFLFCTQFRVSRTCRGF